MIDPDLMSLLDDMRGDAADEIIFLDNDPDFCAVLLNVEPDGTEFAVAITHDTLDQLIEFVSTRNR